MKQSILLVSLVCCMLAFTACGNSSSQQPNNNEKPVVTQEAQKKSNSVYDVTINGIEKSRDYEDKDCVVVSYTFTNNSDENINFNTATCVDVFQNGVELSPTYTSQLLDDDTSSKQIQTNVTIDCQSAYVIGDSADITVEVYDNNYFPGDVLITEKTFTLE